MSVFLRWGVFGILAVAALMYAYNASKRMSERRQAQRPAVVSVQDSETESADEDTPAAEAEPVTPECEQELEVAELALKARREGETFDRLRRYEAIAFQSDVKRRERLENVARKWFERVGADPSDAALRSTVLRDCWKFSPAS